MSPSAWVAFVIAGAAGAVARYAVDLAVARYAVDLAVAERRRGGFPWGTLMVNLSGSLVLGVITGLALHHGLAKSDRIVLGTGFCGAYTTFSTFSFETVRLLEEGAAGAALRNAAGTLVGCAAAAVVGLGITSL